jgi:hypothetical protein
VRHAYRRNGIIADRIAEVCLRVGAVIACGQQPIATARIARE